MATTGSHVDWNRARMGSDCRSEKFSLRAPGRRKTKSNQATSSLSQLLIICGGGVDLHHGADLCKPRSNAMGGERSRITAERANVLVTFRLAILHVRNRCRLKQSKELGIEPLIPRAGSSRNSRAALDGCAGRGDHNPMTANGLWLPFCVKLSVRTLAIILRKQDYCYKSVLLHIF